MAGFITPLPIILEEEKNKANAPKPKDPKSLVIRYGYLRQIAELPYHGGQVGCGSKLVIRTQRGVELGEMLTTTCANSGCGSSVSRKEMLDYIENSGGKDYPFMSQGKVLRIATPDDLIEHSHFEKQKNEMIRFAKKVVHDLDLTMRLVEVERLLGGERIIFYYTSEQWVDFRELVRKLASEYQTRIEMHQVNARNEARLVADYEKCGQHCCCKQFLKVLKPVSMRSAKVQKATLDPLKISGRCGRLMCCLRYEDETYNELRKTLPRRQSRVMTDDGPGTVVDTQILTQLALVRLDEGASPVNAYPVESITHYKDGDVKPARKDETAKKTASLEQKADENKATQRDSNQRGSSQRSSERRDSDQRSSEKRGRRRRNNSDQTSRKDSKQATNNTDDLAAAKNTQENTPATSSTDSQVPICDNNANQENSNQADGNQASTDGASSNASTQGSDQKQPSTRRRGRRRRNRRGGGGGTGGKSESGSAGGELGSN